MLRLRHMTLLAWLAAPVMAAPALAQDLVPGAYVPAPVGYNLVTVGSSFNNGDLAFDTSLPIEQGHATIGGTALGFSRTLNIAGRFASIGMAGNYVLGHLDGLVLGQFREASRSGLGDPVVRLAINLFGAPAMTRQEFAASRSTTILGVSLVVGLPLGQYDSNRSVNIGTNRWSIKPEAGFSRRRGRWTFEGDLGAVFFTDNTNFLNGGTRQQAPIAAAQGHLTYTFRPGLWLAGDGNLWSGGAVTVNGVEQDEQRNSRLGVTIAVPAGRQQIRIAYSFGAFTTIGGDFQSLGLSYSYAWTGHP
jgi:Putative MetA-pathway of phenol degradation